ncbi:thioredoxin domain-containing protein [Herbiconiux solani]|uniref:thioredoxin domain-containing protein n=1 Tax=Herbiconiux solani TaxID=661329 RepID=UPI000825A6D0|nr:DUF255 domain-containing protein [Herbiconiux solani]
MTNRLATAISPYLRSHAENPVDWHPWGEEAFAEAKARNVPVLVSIGYSTCHWCHVMARESFSDPVLAARLNEGFVAVKVDREEHPEVDSAYLAAAGAFTQNLGWPLNVFTTPDGKVFFGGTYSPPVPIEGHPSFGQVLDAVTEAWTTRHDEVVEVSERIASALAEARRGAGGGDAGGPGAGSVGISAEQVAGVVAELGQYEDAQFGGFGGAPKFPVAPVLRFLLEYGTSGAGAGAGAGVAVGAGAGLGAADAGAGDGTPSGGGDAASAFRLATRTLRAMAASDLRDPVEGGFFRYATRRDWTDPHYERMLYDNALLLDAYSTVWAADPSALWAREAAEGIAGFLLDVMQLPSGGFASAQDSESTVDGRRVEGGYYALDADERARQTPPALDEKVLTGWNGLAIGALAHASLVFDRDDWAMAAQHAADYLLTTHLLPEPASGSLSGSHRRLVRASVDGVASPAVATLEDFGMLAEGVLRLAAVTGSSRYAMAGRMLVDSVLPDDESGRRAGGHVEGHVEVSADGAERHLDAELWSADGIDLNHGELAGVTAAGAEVHRAEAPEGSDGSGAVDEEPVFRTPGGGDPVLRSRGLAAELDPSEGAYPSGTSACAAGALLLHALTAEQRYRDAARRALAPLVPLAVSQPIAFGATLELLTRLSRPSAQLVLIEPDPAADLLAPAPASDGASAAQGPEDERMGADGLRAAVRMATGAVVAIATEEQAQMLAESGFELFAGRVTRDGAPTAYQCLDFVCRLPTTKASGLAD